MKLPYNARSTRGMVLPSQLLMNFLRKFNKRLRTPSSAHHTSCVVLVRVNARLCRMLADTKVSTLNIVCENPLCTMLMLSFLSVVFFTCLSVELSCGIQHVAQERKAQKLVSRFDGVAFSHLVCVPLGLAIEALFPVCPTRHPPDTRP